MSNARSATVARPGDWSVDNRGYIHGGFDTPVFEKAKQKHNSRLTRTKNKIKKSTTYGKTSPDVNDVKEKQLNA